MKFQSSGSKKIGDLDKALVSFRGTTTADGGALGINLICADLITRPEFDGNQVVIINGSCAGQVRDINGTTLAGTVTPLSAFDAQITLGTKFAITAIRVTPAEVAAVLTLLGDVFGLVNALLVLTETGGTITTDGTEQDVYINNAPAGVFKPLKVMIDLTPMTATETVVVKIYYRIKSGGGLILKDEETFTGVQDPALINVELEPNRFGVQVTIQRTAGDDKDYDWEVFYEV